MPSDSVPTGAILETPDAKAGLRGSLVRKFLDTDSPVTLQDLLRPRDQGFLASVLAPNSRAISIKVDAESGVSGLIRPGDYVDVVLTQVVEKTDVARRAVSETVLRNIRIIAIDQEMEQGGPTINATAGKVANRSANRVIAACARAGQEDHSRKISRNALLGHAGSSRGYSGHGHYIQLRCVAGNCPPECNCRRPCSGGGLCRW